METLRASDQKPGGHRHQDRHGGQGLTSGGAGRQEERNPQSRRSRRGYDRPFAAEVVDRSQRQGCSQAGSGQAGGVDPVRRHSTWLVPSREEHCDQCTGEEERSGQGQIDHGQVENLSPVPGQGEGVERHPIGGQVAADDGGSLQSGEGGPASRPTTTQAWPHIEKRPGGAKPEQGQAHRHEGEVVKLGHSEYPGEDHFEHQDRRRGQGDAEKNPWS